MRKHILTKIKEELYAMSKSRDIGYTKKTITVDKHKAFSIECSRNPETEAIGKLDLSGEVISYEIYYQVNGKDIDCCTLSCFLNKMDMQFLSEFIYMYIEDTHKFQDVSIEKTEAMKSNNGQGKKHKINDESQQHKNNHNALEKLCKNCAWYAQEEGVCCNGNSEYVADFRWQDEEDGCDKWEYTL